MVNLNISIPDDLHKSLKLESVKREITLKGLVIKLLEDEMNSKKSQNRTIKHEKKK